MANIKPETCYNEKVNNYIIDSRLGKCKIIAVYSFGTLDVEKKKGKCYRITGLSFI